MCASAVLSPAATNDQDLNTISEASKPRDASGAKATGMSLYTSDDAGDKPRPADQSTAPDDSCTADSRTADDSRAADWSRKADTVQHAVLEKEPGWSDKFRFAAEDAPTGDWSRKASTAQHADFTQHQQGQPALLCSYHTLGVLVDHHTYDQKSAPRLGRRQNNQCYKQMHCHVRCALP